LSVRPISQVDHVPKLVGCGMERQGRWITWNGSNVLWIPPDYRSEVTVVKENRIGVGCESGLLYVLNFSAKRFPF